MSADKELAEWAGKLARHVGGFERHIETFNGMSIDYIFTADRLVKFVRAVQCHEPVERREALREQRIAELETERDAAVLKGLELAISVVPGGSICDPQQVADAIRAIASTLNKDGKN